MDFKKATLDKNKLDNIIMAFKSEVKLQLEIIFKVFYLKRKKKISQSNTKLKFFHITSKRSKIKQFKNRIIFNKKQKKQKMSMMKKSICYKVNKNKTKNL